MRAQRGSDGGGGAVFAGLCREWPWVEWRTELDAWAIVGRTQSRVLRERPIALLGAGLLRSTGPHVYRVQEPTDGLAPVSVPLTFDDDLLGSPNPPFATFFREELFVQPFFAVLDERFLCGGDGLDSTEETGFACSL